MQAVIHGRRVGYSDLGQGTALLLMHAFPLNRTMFDAQSVELSKVARVVTFDAPGVGDSERGPVSMDGIAEIGAALLDELGIEEAVVGGVSMGGYAALSFARLHPERLEGLLLADTRAAADSPDARAARGTAAEFVTANGAAAFAEQMMPKLLGAGTRERQHATVAVVRRMIEDAPAQVIADLLQALGARRDHSSLLAAISAPTLVVAGECDELTPPHEGREWAAQLPDGEFAEIPGAGHLANMEQPDAFHAAVRGLLRRIG